jgi:hypothetical protein
MVAPPVKTLIPPLFPLLLALPSSALAQGLNLGASWASEQVLRGVSVAPDQPSPGVDLGWRDGRGWSASLAANRLERDEAGRRWVVLGSVAHRWFLDDNWSLELSQQQRHYPGPPGRRLFNSSETSLQLAWRADWAISLSHNPALGRFVPGQGPRKAPAQSLDLSWRRPLPVGVPLALEAGLGVQRWQGLQRKPFAYGNLGVALDLGRVQMSLSRIESRAGPEHGVAAARSGGRWVGVVSLSM